MDTLWFSTRLRYAATLLVIGISLLFSILSLGYTQDTPSPSASVDCRLVPNPDACYLKQNASKGSSFDPNLSMLPLQTRALGLGGPFSAELKYDATLDWILGVQYLQMFGDTLGFATKFTGGANELRANITAGYAFTKNQQIKLTYEYLTQHLPFEFVSGGVNEWVNQHSLGMGYQYVIRHAILHSLEFSGYATRARSKDLSDITFNQHTLTGDQQGYLYDVNYRHIAGGKENTALASLNLFPFANDTTTLSVGAGYSDIKYDTLYEDNQAANRFAYKVEIAQLLSPKTKVTAGTNTSAASSEYTVGVNHLLPRKFGASLKGQYSLGHGTLPDNKNVTLGFNYPAPEAYSLTPFSGMLALKHWISQPVVYSTRVLAIKDEKVERFQFVTSGTIPAQSLFDGDFLTPVATNGFFSFNDPNIQITYSLLTLKDVPPVAAQPEIKAQTATTIDYTNDLHLQLIGNGPNEAILQSAAPIPVLDSHGQPTLGTYTVFIIATGISGGKTFQVTQSFLLTIKGERNPTWNPGFTLPTAQMGYVYPVPPSAEIDLTAQITLPATDTDVRITFAPDCTPPAWLVLQPCSTNTTHTCVGSGGNPVPNTSPNASFCAAFTATGIPSGTTGTQTFQGIPITQLPIQWEAVITPIQISTRTAVGYEIPLNPYITNTQGLSITPGPGFDTTHWAIVQTSTPNGPLFSLELIAAYIAPGPSPNLTVEASNATSFGSQSKNIPVIIGGTAIYTARWNTSATLPAGMVNAAYSVDLNLDPRMTTRLATTYDGANQPVNPPDTYAFTLESASTPGWTLSNNVLTHAPFTGAEAGTVDIMLTAISELDNTVLVSDGALQTFTITIAPIAPPQWNPNFTPPDAQMGVVYPPVGEVDLTAAITLPPTETGVSFAFAPSCTRPPWLAFQSCSSNAGHTCLSSNGASVPNTAPDASFCAALTATGIPSGNTSTQTFAAIPITQLPPDWAAIITPAQISSRTAVGYEIPLNPYLTNTQGLSIVEGPGFDSTHWEIVTDDAIPENPIVALRLILAYLGPDTSPNLTVEASNATSFGSQSKNIPVIIGGTTAHTALWNNNINVLPPGTVGFPYSLDLNLDSERIARPLATTYDSASQPVDPPDSYAFSGTPPPGWTLNNNVLTHPPFTEADLGTVNITLTAVSMLDDAVLVSDGTPKTFTVHISSSPQFDPNALTPAIQFNLTGDNSAPGGTYPALGLITQGINLTTTITNANQFRTVTFAMQNPNPHFQIKADPANPNIYYLLRNTDHPVTPGSGSSVFAGDISGAPVALGIIATGVSPDGLTTSRTLGTFNITVNPDTSGNIRYNFASSPPAPISLQSATSDGAGGRATITQPSFNASQPTQTYASRFPLLVPNPLYDVFVSNDVATYTNSGAGIPAFVQLSGTTVSFLTPQINEFSILANPNNVSNSAYLNIYSTASGGSTGPHIVPNNLPKLTSETLVLVPYRGVFLNGSVFSDAANLSPNVTMGVNNAFNTTCSQTGRAETTALSFLLPPAPAGLQYRFRQFSLQSPEGISPTTSTGICQGVVNATDLSLTPIGSTPYPACGAGQAAWQVPANPTAGPYAQCSGSSPNNSGITNWRGTGGAAPSNVYSVYGYGFQINRGWIEGGDIPPTYVGMNTRPVPGAVMGFGQDYTGYTDFPVVALGPP